ncbi:hypothetical protein D5086_003762, partial [Populus alba]
VKVIIINLPYRDWWKMAIESVGGSVVSKIAELLVEPAIKQFRYMFCFNDFVQEFDEQMMNLALAFYRLQDAVNVAERNAEEIEIDVNTWLENAKNEIEGVNRLQNEKGKIGKCFTWCPNSMRQFKLSKALAKKTETLRKLEENSRKFPKVSHKAPLQDIEFLPSEGLTPSESSKEAFEQIMKALKDDTVNMIGLYGMGGVGKTTLVKEVGRGAKELQLVDEVLIVTVSQNPNVTDMQDQMAVILGLDFDGKSGKERAGRLWQRLQGKKVLIILDDAWKDIDLKEVGIPFGDAHRGCKTLLTTRLEHICSSMKCQQKVLLRVLSENEAWALFKINAGLRDEDSDLNRVAKKVARECKGLPIALVTVGRALRDKSAVEWEVAFDQLKKSQFLDMEQLDEQNNAYACLKLSYDYLKHEKTKLCFLLCCLFPEDYNIPIEELTRYAVGYGLHQDYNIEDARKRVYVAIKNLKACSMLLGTATEEYVKMHDLVRDVAIQIASSEKYGFMVKAGFGLKEWPKSNKRFEGFKVISLMGNELTELPEGLVCPQLKVLLLELDRGLNVPERFFEGMKAIEVLSLKGGCLSLQSLQFSTNLQSLLLRMCGCKDLIWLRKLQRLEILGFMWWCSVEELPDEIGGLKELRFLDLTGCYNLRRIPVNLIGRLKKLEELLIGDRSFKGWDVVGCDSTEGMNASLTELSSLSHLAVLSLWIPKVECIPRDFVFPRLLKYDIVLGDGYSKTEYPISTRLYLGDISAASLNAKTFEQLFPTVSQIGFRSVEGLENIALSSDQMTTHGHGSQKDFFQRLKHVEVSECGDIRTLFPAKWRQALKNLRRVEINRCDSLEEVFELDEGINEEKELSFLTELQLSWLPELKCIWKGPTRHVSLHSLTCLALYSLHKLTFIFTPSLAQSLIHLETLRIEHCRGLKRLIKEEQDGEREIIPESLGFPKLKTLCIVSCHYLEYVFPVSVSPSFQNLEEMEIREANNLKQVFYSGEGDDIIVKSKNKDGIIDFPQLRKLSLFSGSSCSFFDPKDFAAQLPSLQELTIDGHEECDNLLAQLRGFTSLETLKLSSLLVPDLRIIWKGLVLRNLTTLKVKECKRLTHVFTDSMIASLVQLQVLKISNCEELEQIIAKDNDDENDQILSGSDLQSSYFPNLRQLEITGCNKLKSLFPVTMASGLKKLQTLHVSESSQLLGVFGQDDHASPANLEKEMVLPDLQELLLVQLPSISCFSLRCNDFLFPHLKKLEVDGCPKLTTIFGTRSNGSMSAQSEGFTSLETLKLSSLLVPDLRIIWKGLVLRNLTTLKVKECKRLTHVFTDSMIASLVQLQVLKISNCEELEQIIAKDNDDENDQILSGSDLQSSYFPNLRQLEITGCNKLKSLFPVAMASGLKKLQKLHVSESSQLLGVFGQDDHASPANLGKEMVLPDLHELLLVQLPSISCFSLKCNDFLFPHLKKLEVDGCPKLTTIFGTRSNGTMSAQSEGFTSLETLKLSSLLVPDLRIIWKGLVLRNLTTLKVKECKRLTHVFTDSMIASLVQLQVLKISNCEELEQIIAKDNDDENDQILSGNDLQSSCFPNLFILEIRGCNKLKSLFPVAMASGLKKIQILRVSESSQLLGVFGQGDHASPANTEKEMVLPRLKELLLVQLPSIFYFSLGRYDFLFPHLEKLEVTGCPKLTTESATTSNDTMSAQTEGFMNLKEISIGNLEGVQDLMQVGRLVTNSRGGHELSLLSLKTLHLNLLPDMRCIWKGLEPSYLTTLKVNECKRLTHVFTDNMIATLVQLNFLEISNCEELEQIIAKDNDDENDQILSGSDLQSSCFPNLFILEIRGCNKLKSLFPVAMASGLKKIQILRVSESSQLLGVFGQGDHASPANTEKEMVLPRLKELLLVQLPSIFYFSLGRYDFLFPYLEKLEVTGCPKLTTESATTSNDTMSAQTEGFMNLKEISIGNLEGVQDLMQVGRLVTNSRGGHELSLLSLKTLHLNLLPDMRCIWKGLVPSNLTALKVNECKRLAHIFTDNMIASLVQLKVLEISNCEELEQIIGKDNDDENDQILSGSDLQSSCFPNLCIIEIRGCNKLKSLFPVTMASGLKKIQMLKELLLVQLPSIFCFSLGRYDFLFPHLEKLEVRGCPKLTTESAITSNDSMSAQSEGFMNLKEIYIGNLEGVQELMQVGRLVTNRIGGHEFSLVSLETLHLNLLPDMRCIWKGLVPSNLTAFKVEECKRLTHVFTDSMIASLAQLKVLEISTCDELEQIIAWDNDDEKDQILSGSDLQSACFPNLYRLDIKGCNKLKSLFPIAMASGLKKLQILRVSESSQLLGVFGKGDDALPANTEKVLVLPDLKWLFLQKLPSIVYFSHGCYDFIFPYLSILVVRQCPKLSTRFATTSNGSMSAHSE